MAPAFVGIYIVLAFLAALMGRKRAMGFFGTLLLSIILTPLLTIIMLLLTAPRRDLAVHRR